MAYTWAGMRKLTWKEVKELHKKGKLAGYYKLYEDGSEAVIDSNYDFIDDILDHQENGGEFGEEIGTTELKLADGKTIIAPDVVDISKLGFLDELEYTLWSTIEDYMLSFGIRTLDDEPDWATVKAVQECILNQFIAAGVNFKIFDDATQAEIDKSSERRRTRQMANKKNEKLEVVKVALEIVLTQEDIDDIMCGALEGGINYWCDEAKVMGDYLGEYGSEQIARGGKLRLHLPEPFDKDNTEYYELDLEKFKKGVEMWAITPVGCNCLEQIDGKIRFDTCDADAIVCDAIIQYALFGDVIFG